MEKYDKLDYEEMEVLYIALRDCDRIQNRWGQLNPVLDRLKEEVNKELTEREHLYRGTK